jgi:ferredoxin-NADP reductase
MIKLYGRNKGSNGEWIFLNWCNNEDEMEFRKEIEELEKDLPHMEYKFMKE